MSAMRDVGVEVPVGGSYVSMLTGLTELVDGVERGLE